MCRDALSNPGSFDLYKDFSEGGLIKSTQYDNGATVALKSKKGGKKDGYQRA